MGLRGMHEAGAAVSGGPAPRKRRGTPRAVSKDVNDPAFPHGTERGYFRGCKQRCCLDGKRKAQKRRDIFAQRGVRLTMPVGPVRDRVQALMASHVGFTVAALSRASGVNQRTVGQLLSGETKDRIRTVTALALMEVTPAQIAAECRMVPSKRPHQQVMSMMALGWTGAWISMRLGHSESCGTGAPQFMYHRWDWMTRDLAGRIDALAREVGDRPGPSSRTATRARKRGWFVPGAYDNEGNLLPGAVRTDDRREAAAEEAEQRVLLRARVAEMRSRRMQPADIAAALSVPKSRVDAAVRWLDRHADATCQQGA